MSGCLHHVALTISPGTEAGVRRFYGELLGLDEAEPDSVPAGSLWFDLADDVQLHLFVDSAAKAIDRSHVCLALSDLQLVLARLAAGGHSVERVDAVNGRERVFVRDPSSNRLELTALLGSGLAAGVHDGGPRADVTRESGKR